jgi:hypothetical protein
MDYGYHSIALWLLPKVSIDGNINSWGKLLHMEKALVIFIYFLVLR